jgi:hypothetical protein
MRILRLLLLGWLAVAVPVTAMASIVNTGHCQRIQQTPMAAVVDHSQHGAHARHPADSMEISHMGQQKAQADRGCNCGCNCFAQHCTTGFSGLMGGLYAASGFFDGVAQQGVRALPGTLASAHHLELLRPPTLS